ncbi:hypothetical protein WJX84_004926 [Apatococcus fuscideae]|uniref:Vacuolar protein sorting-associated protein 26 n=1 Tax=Apatococcus fuscideae TaxID=2026836 RepID=A0AAW1TCL1_9CHLO
MQKWFGNLGQTVPIQLEFRRKDGQPVKNATVKVKGLGTEQLPLFNNKDSIYGEIKVSNIPGKKFEHQGIKVQLLGQIELASERGHPHDFLSLVRDLSPPGDLVQQEKYSFEFNDVEMQYDSYRGLQVRLRYILRVTVSKGYGGSVKDFPFWVRNFEPLAPPATGPPIKASVGSMLRLPQSGTLHPVAACGGASAVAPGTSMTMRWRVGIEECLHIEFEYDKAKYHLKDTVVGKIYFLLVRIKLKHMEVEIRRRETTGSGQTAHNENETLAKYEIMDGAPVRGEAIPIRLFLSPYDLTPTYKLVHNKFSVKYFLNLVLVDEEDRARTSSRQEIQLYRASDASQANGLPAAAATLIS